MDTVYYTLQEFMLHTKGMTYLLMGAALIFILAYGTFLLDRDDD